MALISIFDLQEKKLTNLTASNKMKNFLIQK